MIKRYRAFRVLASRWMYLSVCCNKTTSDNLIHVFHSRHDWKERESIERRSIDWLFRVFRRIGNIPAMLRRRLWGKWLVMKFWRRIYSNLGPHLVWNTTCIILDQTITIYCMKSDDIRILQCKRYLLALYHMITSYFSCWYWLHESFQWIIIEPTLTLTPVETSIFLLEDITCTYFSNFHKLSHYFPIITNHCINNDQHNVLCQEAWNLVSTKLFATGKNLLFEMWTMY